MVARQDGRLLDHQRRLGTQVPASERSVLERNEVRVGTVGALRGKLEHLGRRAAMTSGTAGSGAGAAY